MIKKNFAKYPKINIANNIRSGTTWTKSFTLINNNINIIVIKADKIINNKKPLSLSKNSLDAIHPYTNNNGTNKDSTLNRILLLFMNFITAWNPEEPPFYMCEGRLENR